MSHGAGGSGIAIIFKITILSVVILVLIVVLVLLIGWWHGKRQEKPGIGDIDWDEERRILEAIAAEKKAKRLAEQAARMNPAGRKKMAECEFTDPMENWNREELGDEESVPDDEDPD